jgi:hypothetical protein
MVTSLAFVVLPSLLVYMVLTAIRERGRESIIAGAILFALTVIYNVGTFLSTRNAVYVGKSGIQKTMGICLRIGGSLFALGVILTVFLLLVSLLESATKM